MANTKISAFSSSLTGATMASGDLLPVVDISDTTQGAGGSTKKITAAETVIGLSALGLVTGPASATDNAIVRFDGTTGKLVQNSAMTVADTTGCITMTGGAIERVIYAGGGGNNTFAILVNHLGVSAVYEGYNGLNTFCAGTSLNTYYGLWVELASCFGFYDFNNNTPDTRITRVGTSILGVRGTSNTGGAALSFVEQTAPAAPAANGCYVYAQDNGGGKTQLMARFSSGAAQQIAIEP